VPQSFSAIGTHWQIDLDPSVPEKQSSEIFKKIYERIEEFDRTYSRFRPDSLVTEISLQAGEYQLPADSALLLTLYRKLYDLTDGLFTPLVGQLLSDAGYDATYSLQEKKLHPVPAWSNVHTYHESILTTTEPVLLDFGAGGKGYLVDIISGEITLQEDEIIDSRFFSPEEIRDLIEEGMLYKPEYNLAGIQDWIEGKSFALEVIKSLSS